jgi:hypothetical protein
MVSSLSDSKLTDLLIPNKVLDPRLASPSGIYTPLRMYVTLSSPSVRCRYLAQVPIQWEEVSVTPILKGGKTVIPDTAIQSVKRNTVALKGGPLVHISYRNLIYA